MDEFASWLSQYAHNTTSPLLMVLTLGVLFALDPCLMLTNIAAIGYIGKQVETKKSALIGGFYYTIGRTLSYGVLGVVLIGILRIGGSLEPVEHFFHSWGEIILIVFFLLSGVLLLVSDYMPALKNPVKNLNYQRFQGRAGAFALGVILTLSFCPTNALIFFGMMVPYCSASAFGYAFPFVFALVPAIPVVAISCIIAYSLNRIGTYFNRVKLIGACVKYFVAMLFIAIGIMFAVEHWWGESHHHHHHHHHDHTECVVEHE